MSVCSSDRPCFCLFMCHTLGFPIPAVVLQNVSNKSYLVCVEREKLCILGQNRTPEVYEARQSKTMNMIILGKAS